MHGPDIDLARLRLAVVAEELRSKPSGVECVLRILGRADGPGGHADLLGRHPAIEPVVYRGDQSGELGALTV
jgi:hypothetical protein